MSILIDTGGTGRVNLLKLMSHRPTWTAIYLPLEQNGYDYDPAKLRLSNCYEDYHRPEFDRQLKALNDLVGPDPFAFQRAYDLHAGKYTELSVAWQLCLVGHLPIKLIACAPGEVFSILYPRNYAWVVKVNELGQRYLTKKPNPFYNSQLLNYADEYIRFRSNGREWVYADGVETDFTKSQADLKPFYLKFNRKKK